MITRNAFTMIEILVTITIIMALVGMLMGAFTVVSRRASAAATAAVVAQVHQACQVYRGEDKKRRFPPEVADGVLYVEFPDQSRTWDGATPLSGMMLGAVGLKIHSDGCTQLANGRWAIADAWYEPLRYHVDALADGTIDRPRDSANAQVAVPGDVSDWNPQGTEPFAYVWSYGRPKTGSTLKANIAKWHYVKETPRP